ncbi:MAG TPA: tRNA uridine-5-carboxymethylaminomethyl(34) synthesis GTPase MnmE [Mobilitalea sp.]|nr:tRNA uridine-5-carboxymethylaminomethyl(34) synthesis GTPase MnmE [Mobilitalea sp.]
MKTDTIAAIATGLSSAGISIVRISGEQAFQIIDQIYHSKSGNKMLSCEKSHTLHYGYIADGDQIIDEVLVAIMKGPSTYTREDVIEIDCHGGIVVTRKILETVLKYGARIAEPGEFTKRAFLNGRIDLSQAEAVADIINSKNERALENSIKQLRGKELELIKNLRETILRDIAFIESALDDPEHISLDGFTEELTDHITEEIKLIEKLIQGAKNGRILREGIKTVILGKPNAGKSSLLNTLLGEDRAIVTDIPGTTRDTLEETLEWNGITLNIIDTAGIRETEDVVEKLGVAKAVRYSAEADLVIFMVDSSVHLDVNDEAILELIREKKAIILLNKSDLPQKVTITELAERTEHPVISVSLIDNVGIEELEALIRKMFLAGKISFNDELYITNERHQEALKDTLESLEMVQQSIENGMAEDFYSIDLLSAYEMLGKIIGEKVEEDLVNMIFKEFCMGK